MCIDNTPYLHTKREESSKTRCSYDIMCVSCLSPGVCSWCVLLVCVMCAPGVCSWCVLVCAPGVCSKHYHPTAAQLLMEGVDQQPVPLTVSCSPSQVPGGAASAAGHLQEVLSVLLQRRVRNRRPFPTFSVRRCLGHATYLSHLNAQLNPS